MQFGSSVATVAVFGLFSWGFSVFRADIGSLDDCVRTVEINLAVVKGDLDLVNFRLETFERRFDQLDGKLDRLLARSSE